MCSPARRTRWGPPAARAAPGGGPPVAAAGAASPSPGPLRPWPWAAAAAAWRRRRLLTGRGTSCCAGHLLLRLRQCGWASAYAVQQQLHSADWRAGNRIRGVVFEAHPAAVDALCIDQPEVTLPQGVGQQICPTKLPRTATWRCFDGVP
jgi:hypothetical protein